jgi:hypothetical protein
LFYLNRIFITVEYDTVILMPTTFHSHFGHGQADGIRALESARAELEEAGQFEKRFGRRKLGMTVRLKSMEAKLVFTGDSSVENLGG